jgi:hypothetical protein
MTRLRDKLLAQAEGDRQQGEVLRCSQLFCANLSTRSDGSGFSMTLCKRHTEHLAKHGDVAVPSIPGTLLKQYVTVARRWITTE